MTARPVLPMEVSPAVTLMMSLFHVVSVFLLNSVRWIIYKLRPAVCVCVHLSLPSGYDVSNRFSEVGIQRCRFSGPMSGMFL